MSISATRSRCRAKNPATCAYHGNPLAPETQADAIATSESILNDTRGVLIEYDKRPDMWSDAVVKRVAHLITATDAPQFTKDILKARYDIAADNASVGAIENRAGSMYRHRMRYLENKIADAKRSSKVQTDRDLDVTLRSVQFQAELEAEQYRGYARDALNSNNVTSAQTRRENADFEMARSLAASAQVLRIEQLCENLNLNATRTAVPAGFTF